jgi:hypothetical protein
MKSQIIPVRIKIPTIDKNEAIDIAIEIIMGGIDMISDRKLKEKISCEVGDIEDANI